MERVVYGYEQNAERLKTRLKFQIAVHETIPVIHYNLFLTKEKIMEQGQNKQSTLIDEYIMQFPPEVQEKLNTLREVIREAAPNAQEKISYQMPTFYLSGNLVHFAAYKNHLGFYPAASGIEALKKELTPYKTSKGAIQFPLEKQIPCELVKSIVKFRVEENLQKAENQRKKD